MGFQIPPPSVPYDPPLGFDFIKSAPDPHENTITTKGDPIFLPYDPPFEISFVTREIQSAEIPPSVLTNTPQNSIRSCSPLKSCHLRPPLPPKGYDPPLRNCQSAPMGVSPYRRGGFLGPRGRGGTHGHPHTADQSFSQPLSTLYRLSPPGQISFG